MTQENSGNMEAALPLNSPVTLVVKTPNQRHEDVQVDCEIGWTVHKLKTHLSNVYPTKPESRHQRIIYSGQLLNDELKLKDVLRGHEEGRPHTVHLVCTICGAEPSSSNQHNQPSTTSVNSGLPSSTSQSSSSPSAQTVTSSVSDGLRYRGQTIAATPPYYMYNAQMMNAAAQAQRQGGYYPMMTPPYWVQQMYNHQMMAARGVIPPGFMYPPGANFPMQQIPAQWHPQLANPQTPPLSPVPTPQVDQQARQQVPAQPQQAMAAVAQPAQQDVQMNANGGPLLDEDEDEDNANNDWLDKIYTFIRLMILLSIVWFYSSTGRFVMMIVLLAVIYLYQSGFLHRLFRFNQGNAREEVHMPAAQQQPQEQGEQPQGDHPPQDVQNAANENGGADDSDGSSSSNDNSVQPAPPPPPPGPSVIHVAFNFITTFFTSLIPQGPPPPVVN